MTDAIKPGPSDAIPSSAPAWQGNSDDWTVLRLVDDFRKLPSYAELTLPEWFDENGFTITRKPTVRDVPTPASPWHDAAEIPSVKKNDTQEYVVAVHDEKSGKVITLAAHYLNAFQLERDDVPCATCDSTCENGDGCPHTGWYTLVGDDRYDAGCFYALSLRDGRSLKGWRELPKWEDHTAAPVGEPVARISPDEIANAVYLEASTVPTADERSLLDRIARRVKYAVIDELSYADLRASGGIFPEVYTTAPPSPAVGAEEIARVVCEYMSNGNIQFADAGKTLRADCIATAKAILALLSGKERE